MTPELEDSLGLLVGSRDLADRLLSATTLRHLAGAPLSELERLMPKRAAARLHAALRVAKEAVVPARPKEFQTTRDFFCHVQPYFVGRETERMVVVACDRRVRPVATEIVGEGSPFEVTVRLGDLFAAAVRHRAAAILIAHCHPSGDPTPSEPDRTMTERAVAGGLLLGIEVLDHVVVAGDRYVSIHEEVGGFGVSRAIVLP